jgi:hypothetical protein
MSDPSNANEAIELGLFEPSETSKSDTSDTKPARIIIHKEQNE